MKTTTTRRRRTNVDGPAEPTVRRRVYDLHTLLAVQSAIDKVMRSEVGFSFNQWLKDNIAAAKRTRLKSAEAEEEVA